jgi:hypothetical protein
VKKLFPSLIAVFAVIPLLVACTKAETNKFLPPEVDTRPLEFDGFTSTFSCRGKMDDGTFVYVSKQAPARPELGTLENDSLLVVETRKLSGDRGGYQSVGKLIYFGKISNFEVRASEGTAMAAEVAKSGAVTLTHFPVLSQAIVDLSPTEQFGLDCKNKTATHTK